MLLTTLYHQARRTDRSTLAGKIRSKILRLTANAVARPDALMPVDVDGLTIDFPVRHSTPFVWQMDPDNSKCLGRIAKLVANRWPLASIIDVGANVGDSSAIIRSQGVVNPILAIEGVDAFFNVLKHNAAILNVSPLKAFVGTIAETRNTQQTVLTTGNAVLDIHATATSSATAVEFAPLITLVERAKIARPVKLIKTDIEGLDLPVLAASIELIEADKPVLFFELHVSDADEARFSIGWREFLHQCRTLGYDRALLWQRSTDYLAAISLADTMGLEAIDSYLRNRAGHIYVDVCLIHRDDQSLAQELHQVEVEQAGTKRRSTPNG